VRSGARAAAPWLAISLTVIALDQWSKAWISARLGLGASDPVASFFNLVLRHNRGAAFSMLDDASGWQDGLFLAIGLAASAALLWMLARARGGPVLRIALALVLGGALGNVIDRIHHGFVVDFLEFHWDWLAVLFPGGFFPAFNVADSAITCGAILLVGEELLRSSPGPRADGKGDSHGT
jgi:signal peptidase II